MRKYQNIRENYKLEEGVVIIEGFVNGDECRNWNPIVSIDIKTMLANFLDEEAVDDSFVSYAVGKVQNELLYRNSYTNGIAQMQIKRDFFAAKKADILLKLKNSFLDEEEMNCSLKELNMCTARISSFETCIHMMEAETSKFPLSDLEYQPKRICLPLDDESKKGFRLVAEKNTEDGAKEIMVYLEDDEDYMQDIAIIGPKCHFDENNVIFEKPIHVRVFEDENDESYTYSKEINQY